MRNIYESIQVKKGEKKKIRMQSRLKGIITIINQIRNIYEKSTKIYT